MDFNNLNSINNLMNMDHDNIEAASLLSGFRASAPSSPVKAPLPSPAKDLSLTLPMIISRRLGKKAKSEVSNNDEEYRDDGLGYTSADSSNANKKNPGGHRLACHRCGNVRKNSQNCTDCPQTFCKICVASMMTQFGNSVFDRGCPKCKNVCCCKKKLANCSNRLHCYRKCPAGMSKTLNNAAERKADEAAKADLTKGLKFTENSSAYFIKQGQGKKKGGNQSSRNQNSSASTLLGVDFPVSNPSTPSNSADLEIKTNKRKRSEDEYGVINNNLVIPPPPVASSVDPSYSHNQAFLSLLLPHSTASTDIMGFNSTSYERDGKE